MMLPMHPSCGGKNGTKKSLKHTTGSAKAELFEDNMGNDNMPYGNFRGYALFAPTV